MCTRCISMKLMSMAVMSPDCQHVQQLPCALIRLGCFPGTTQPPIVFCWSWRLSVSFPTRRSRTSWASWTGSRPAGICRSPSKSRVWIFWGPNVGPDADQHRRKLESRAWFPSIWSRLQIRCCDCLKTGRWGRMGKSGSSSDQRKAQGNCKKLFLWVELFVCVAKKERMKEKQKENLETW